jgi:hypothetical protein
MRNSFARTNNNLAYSNATMYFWIGLIVLFVLAIAFVLIARAGRKLRTTYVLPEEAASARLEAADGKIFTIRTDTQFYLGSHPHNEIVLSRANREYMVCIFYHRRRFAYQTLSGRPEILVNGETQLAGYLLDGDVLTIAGEEFTFRAINVES